MAKCQPTLEVLIVQTIHSSDGLEVVTGLVSILNLKFAKLQRLVINVKAKDSAVDKEALLTLTQLFPENSQVYFFCVFYKIYLLLNSAINVR